MLRNIIGVLLAFTLIALLVIWIVSGGPRTLVNETKESILASLPNSDTVGFHLPWQPIDVFPTLDITQLLQLSGGDTIADQEAQLQELESQYDELAHEASNRRVFGTPSPYAGKVTFIEDGGGVRETAASSEYVQISAYFGNSAPINLAGWSLESALSHVRVALPLATSPLIANTTNTLNPIILEPGSLALVMSGSSPVGVSFRENMCSGYLGQFQTFTPPLIDECPTPSEVLPLTGENLQRYGDTCFDAINSLASCRFPQNLPANISGACRSYLTSSLSYNGCVSANRYRTNFQKNMWRVYLGSSQELWRNSHDAIRLIDAEGRTVDVFVY